VRYIKKSGLIVLAAVAAMAFAGTASATELTSPAGTKLALGTEVTAELVGGPVVIDGASSNYECTEAPALGKLEQQGSSVTVKGSLVEWWLGGCGSSKVSVLKKGTVELHTQEGSSNGNGTITVSGTEVTMEASTGLHCIFTTNNTDLGVFTGSKNTGGHAKVDLAGIVPRTAGRSGIFCGTSTGITGSYTITSPSYLDLD